LCGATLDRWLKGRETLPRWTTAVFGTLTAAAAAVAVSFERWEAIPLPLPEGFDLSPATVLAVSAAGALGLAVVTLLSGLRYHARVVAAGAIVALMGLELAVFGIVFPHYDEQKSPRPIAVAAARLSAQDETVGIFDDEGLAGGILYYGDRRIAILPRPPQVRRFLQQGGRLIVLERWKLPWLEGVGTFEVLAHERRGRRQLAIVTPTSRDADEVQNDGIPPQTR
jgi:hypothetical protein